MKEKLKSSIKAFKGNGIERAKVVKLIAVFAATQLLLWVILSNEPDSLPSLERKKHLQDSIMISLPIKLLGTLNSTPPTRMSLKHEPSNLLIQEVFIYNMEEETAQEGVAEIEINAKDLKSILDLGDYQQFIAFPWNSKLLSTPEKLTQTKKEPYEIHLD